jgi:hypothetical protein
VKTITPYQAEAITLVVRHTLLTADLAHRLLCPGNTRDAARKLLDALWGKGWLQRHERIKGFRYYVLTAEAATVLGLHRRHARPLGLTALIRAYGAAAFCAQTGVGKLSPQEFADAHPRLCARGVSRRGYFERDGRLGFIQVDVAQDPRAVAEKLERLAVQRARIPGFAPLFRERRFLIAVVTPCESKRTSIERAIRKRLRSQMPWELHVVPELLQLLTWLEVPDDPRGPRRGDPRDLPRAR